MEAAALSTRTLIYQNAHSKTFSQCLSWANFVLLNRRNWKSSIEELNKVKGLSIVVATCLRRLRADAPLTKAHSKPIYQTDWKLIKHWKFMLIYNIIFIYIIRSIYELCFLLMSPKWQVSDTCNSSVPIQIGTELLRNKQLFINSLTVSLYFPNMLYL